MLGLQENYYNFKFLLFKINEELLHNSNLKHGFEKSSHSQECLGQTFLSSPLCPDNSEVTELLECFFPSAFNMLTVTNYS